MKEQFHQKLREQLMDIQEQWQMSGHLKPGDLFVVGCSTSEIAGERIGTAGSKEIAAIIHKNLEKLENENEIHLCFQCCEHLNRAIVMERSTMNDYQLNEVSVIPVANAGGAMAAYAFEQLKEPVVVETVTAHAGMDIGETMIGMHLKPVAIPFRLQQRFLGEARLNAAYTRPKRIGGARAVYPE
ncbi:TIGR01440 family protein [Virgibacillus pantothenticus]|nr:TIGR01440 family protein [Virgibacillus pantothenticus]MBU8566547.1 TIGR01440 family protein [Virgibacillus pantothenticus]MBU8599039.1 TIGR01440 family protein [Virgibacillus pantothenticus]MBU8634704.1 TIGR01440 family protein [Virgibacillus pantothenticus]MBU8641213.1 TIGR01440 family protein [Virgibacillus pantothenticus]MBU8645291.1 TIGR01440 family protein [Virgibacillus pantothenticus]